MPNHSSIDLLSLSKLKFNSIWPFSWPISKVICTTLIAAFSTQQVRSQNYNDLVITEIMADETPSVGLPEVEYVEIYNRSPRAVSLNRCRFSYGNTSVLLPNQTILPNEYAVLCHRDRATLLAAVGKVIPVSSLSLTNTGTTLAIYSPANKLLFSVTYSENWYRNATKKLGGWALEMIDVGNPCGEDANWKETTDALGGTPGKANSVAAANPDRTPPQIVYAVTPIPAEINVVFDEKVDSISATNRSNYQIDGGAAIKSIKLQSPQSKVITISLAAPMQAGVVYNVTAKNVADCTGNLLAETQTTVSLPSVAQIGDVVLNEILFNPRPGGVDFVEIYNRTDKYIDLKDWQLANVTNATVGNQKKIIETNFTLPPRQFLALSTNSKTVLSQYSQAKSTRLLEVPQLPSFSDDQGGVVLIDPQRRIFDRFDYNQDFHFALLDDRSGVSLERINYNLPTNDRNNWHSAAAASGYATPGVANSQGLNGPAQNDNFSVEPQAFTPDGDGVDDFTTIRYVFPSVGNVATVSVFDILGRQVGQIAQSQSLATEGLWQWDGINASGERVRTGNYVVLIELINLDGRRETFKKRIVVGSRY